MGTYNVTKIESWLKDFTSAKDKFYNTYYSDFKNSYIKKCNDSAVVRMRNKLSQHYERINRINGRIKNIWEYYLHDLKVIDDKLAGAKGSANDSAIASKLAKLPTLKEYKSNLSIKINSASAVVGTVDKLGWSEDKDWGANLQTVLDRTEATITVAGTAVIEGIGKFGEGIVDACAPIVTEAYCLWNLEFDGTFTEEKAEEARQNSRDFVSKEHVKTFFDDAYSESLRESAYGFDTVREIGNEVGIVISAVGVSAVTHGAIPPSVLYGMSKAGNYVEENFQDENNGYLESILKGYGHGALDGIFFEIGMKGDKIAKSAATAVTKNALKEGGSAVLKKVGILGTKMLFEAGTAVAQDCSSILLNVGFSDDIITDESGQTIKFNNFSDKWNYYFEQYGGTKALYTSMGTAFFLSALSDSGDVFGKGTTQAAKRELNGLDEILAKNADVNITVKNADLDINASKISKNASDINIKNINPNDAYINSGFNVVPGWAIDQTYDIPFLKKYNIKGTYIMNKNAFVPENIKLINKNTRFGRVIINISDDINPKDVFSVFKKPDNIIIVKNGYQITSNGSIVWLKNAKVDYGSKFVQFDKMINMFEQYYPGESFERIKNYLKTGNELQLTSKGGIRTYVTKNCDADDLVKYLDYNQKPLYADFSEMLNEFSKYYPDEALIRLKMYVEKGNLDDITRSGNIRNFVETLDKNYIMESLEQIDNIKTDKQVYDILNDFVKECDTMGVDGYDIIREISTNTKNVSDFPSKYADKLRNTNIDQIERSFYKLKIDQSHQWVKETQKNYYELIDKGVLKISKFDVDRALSNVKIHDTFESFQKAYGSGDASNVGGFANSQTGEIHIRNGQSIETVYHEINHLLGEIIRPGEIKFSNYSLPWEYRGLNEGATEYIAQKFAKLKGLNTRPAYEYAVAAIEKIDEALEKLGTGTSVTEIYMNKDSDALKTFFDSVMENDYSYDSLDNALTILAYPECTIDRIEKMYNVKINKNDIKQSCYDIINNIMGDFEIRVKKILKGK